MTDDRVESSVFRLWTVDRDILLSTSIHGFTATVRPPFKGDTRVFERGG
jgi:hypothetical protein